jgi:citrate/tricarballylate utilization protein
MHATEALSEADRLMTICNSCRYCEGICAVFPAMEMRRSFTSGDLNYLANLCHGCGACYYDCQFSPPHEFQVNVPKTLAIVRAESYKAYAWPRPMAVMFERNGAAIGVLSALSVCAFILGFIAFNNPADLFAVHTGEGAFYRLMPHNSMVAVFGAAFGFAIFVMIMSFRSFWNDIGEPVKTLGQPEPVWQATKDAGTLKYLDGGGPGCMNEDETPNDNRRLYHHFTMYGFFLCFAATTSATGYHYLLGMEAPYPWYDLPVVLGTLGGIGLIIGPIGLLKAKFSRDPAMQDTARFGGDTAFILMLLLTSVTGLLLLVLRATPLMGVMLALHLGVVFALFVTMPYSKMMHGLFRFGALVRYARERKTLHPAE